MREADLARPDAQAAADQRRHRGAVVRRAERPAAADPAAARARPRPRRPSRLRALRDGCSGGRMPGRQAASSDLPAPGGPLISRLCPPAAAISSARLATSWPLTCARSGPPTGGSASAGWRRRHERGALEVREQREQVGRGDHFELARPARLAALRRRADQALVDAPTRGSRRAARRARPRSARRGTVRRPRHSATASRRRSPRSPPAGTARSADRNASLPWAGRPATG